MTKNLICIQTKIKEFESRDTYGMSLHEYLEMSWQAFRKWDEGNMSEDELASWGYCEGTV